MEPLERDGGLDLDNNDREVAFEDRVGAQLRGGLTQQRLVERIDNNNNNQDTNIDNGRQTAALPVDARREGERPPRTRLQELLEEAPPQLHDPVWLNVRRVWWNSQPRIIQVLLVLAVAFCSLYLIRFQIRSVLLVAFIHFLRHLGIVQMYLRNALLLYFVIFVAGY